MRTLTLLAAGAFAATLGVSAATAAVFPIASGAPNGSIGLFGYDATQTFGQVFTAPTTGTLDSFTLYLSDNIFGDGPIGGVLYGGVGKWNGDADFHTGGGVDEILYTSGEVDADRLGAFKFLTNGAVHVVADQLYVAYLTVLGMEQPQQGAAEMPLANAGDYLNYFVSHNGSFQQGTEWDYIDSVGNAQFEATFNSVPEPATWALMIGGFGMAGAMLRRRRLALARI